MNPVSLAPCTTPLRLPSTPHPPHLLPYPPYQLIELSNYLEMAPIEESPQAGVTQQARDISGLLPLFRSFFHFLPTRSQCSFAGMGKREDKSVEASPPPPDLAKSTSETKTVRGWEWGEREIGE